MIKGNILNRAPVIIAGLVGVGSIAGCGEIAHNIQPQDPTSTTDAIEVSIIQDDIDSVPNHVTVLQASSFELTYYPNLELRLEEQEEFPTFLISSNPYNYMTQQQDLLYLNAQLDSPFVAVLPKGKDEKDDAFEQRMEAIINQAQTSQVSGKAVMNGAEFLARAKWHFNQRHFPLNVSQQQLAIQLEKFRANQIQANN